MRIALIGTRGVPARYGGFETCVEEVGARLVDAGHEVVVYCRPDEGARSADRPTTYRGMTLVDLPALHKRSLETLSHTALSVLHRSMRGVDAALVFNGANAPLLPVIRAMGIPVATHVDGLEWQRAKWSGLGQKYYRVAEALSVRWSDALIADAQGIADYYEAEFGAPTELIAYGAPITAKHALGRLAELELRPGRYHLVVARFEPENHVAEIVEGYVASSATLPLIVVGSAPYASDYIERVHGLADERVRFMGGVWDQQLLDQLYAGALTYLHGHSVGGTNPSLLRAAGAGAYTVAYDVGFNREVLEDHGRYFSTPDDIALRVKEAEADPEDANLRGLALQHDISRYNWDDVAERYEQLCLDLVSGARRRNRALTGRRRGMLVPIAAPVSVQQR